MQVPVRLPDKRSHCSGLEGRPSNMYTSLPPHDITFTSLTVQAQQTRASQCVTTNARHPPFLPPGAKKYRGFPRLPSPLFLDLTENKKGGMVEGEASVKLVSYCYERYQGQYAETRKFTSKLLPPAEKGGEGV